MSARITRSREEHKLQCECVDWFRKQYPRYEKLIFAVPNGGERNKKEAASMKREGVTAGVSDIIVAIPNRMNHGLYMEFKSAKGTQSKAQKEFQKAVTEMRYRYVVIRTFTTFVKIIREQLKNR